MIQPKLSFDVSVKYETFKLSQLASPNARIGWQNLRRSEFSESGDAYIVTGTDFENGFVNFKECKFVDLERYEMDPKIKIHENDILITKDGTIGKVAIVKGLDKKATLNAGVFVLNDISPAIDRGYFYHYLRSPLLLKFIKSASTGGTILHLNQSVLLKFPISLPDMAEQQKIAAFFTALDKKLGIINRRIELLDRLRGGVLRGIFSRKFCFPDENGRPLPEWKVMAMRDLGVFKNGISKSKDDFGYGVPFVNLQDVFGKNRIFDSDFDLINASDAEVEDFDLRKGDVLFVRSSVKPEGVGLPSVVAKNLENTVYSGFLIRCRFKGNDLIDEFKKYCFVEPEFRKQVLSKSTSSANTNINQPSLESICVKVPSITEQKKIATFLGLIDERIEKAQEKRSKLTMLKKSFMQKMFV